jgi:membrane-associated phospholipid phosphatase
MPRLHLRGSGSSRARWTRYVRSIRWPVLACVPAAVALVRKRRSLGLPRPVSVAVATTAPLAVAGALPRGRVRAAAIWGAQMWMYKVSFEVPYDDPEDLYGRLRIDEPIGVDRALGGGEVPTARLQRRLRRPPKLSSLDRLASLLYFTWELEPHAAMLWVLLRHPEGFARAAGRLGATFDLTLLGYFARPTAPPWWASEREGRMEQSVRRVVAEVGAELRGKPRPGIDHNADANPWAAMPSDHFASALMTAMVLTDFDRRLGAAAGAYALVLGAVLVYTGEHYVSDLIAGLLLAVGVNAAAPAAEPAAARLTERISALAPPPA